MANERINGPAPEHPLHHNCRCILVPVLEGTSDLVQSGNLNYRDWFNRQSEDNKLDILGPSRYAIFKKTGMGISAFIKDNKILTLKELGVNRVTRAQIRDDKDIINNPLAPNNPPDNPQTPPIINPPASQGASEPPISPIINNQDMDIPLSDEQLSSYQDRLLDYVKDFKATPGNKKAWAQGIIRQLQKMPPKLQHLFFNNYTELSSYCVPGKEAYFSPSDMMVHLLPNHIKDGKEVLDTFFHEIGHAIDNSYGDVALKFKYQYDYDDYIARAQGLGKLDKKHMYKVLEGYKRGDVSDLFKGLSKGQFKGDYGHKLEYYNTRSIKQEGFAHIVSSFQSDRRVEIGKFFPTAYNQFLEWLDSLD
jgi:hypothetical protein